MLPGALALLLLLSCAIGAGAADGAGRNRGQSAMTAGLRSDTWQAPPQPRCVSYDGREVDWWLLLKYPSGEEEALLDSSSFEQQTPSQQAPGGNDQRNSVSPGGGSSNTVRRALRGGSGVGIQGGIQGGSQLPGGDTSCSWRTGFNVNDPDGPLRATLAAALSGQAAGSFVVSHGKGGAASLLPQGPRKLLAGGDSTQGMNAMAKASGSSVAYVFYNDADPEGVEHWGFAHAKGVLLFGPEGGVWITHSFPRYPGRPHQRRLQTEEAGRRVAMGDGAAAEGGKGDPGDGHGAEEGDWDVVQRPQTVFGQHALCLELPREQLLRVADSLLVARAFVYEYSASEELLERYEAIRELIEASEADRGGGAADTGSRDGSRPLAPPERNVSQHRVVTSGGSEWLHVAKSPNHTVPFHEEVLEPLLGEAMAWETWRVGTSYPSECPPDAPFSSFNVRRVHVPMCPRDGGGRDGLGGAGGGGGGGGAAASWDSLRDHSKWGVSAEGLYGSRYGAGAAAETVGTVCVGDLNRQPSQRYRGGGYVCRRQAGLWEAFRELVAEVEPCPRS